MTDAASETGVSMEHGMALEAWDARLGAVRIVAGSDAIEIVGVEVRPLGSRALVVTDPGLRSAGHVDRAVRSLEGAGISVAVFDGVEENPTTRHVAAGVEAARRARADCLVAVGGGSAMDCTKGINFLLTQGGRMEDYQGRGVTPHPMLPSVAVPSTAGTGSDAQSFALISREETHEKMACGDPQAMFRTVVLDPAVARTAPREVVSAAGMDAISHAVESYVSRGANPVSRIFAREAWRRIDARFEAVLGPGASHPAWGEMQLGAHLAGAAIELSMLGAAHACSNPLTARYGVVHGHAVGLMLPHVVRLNAARRPGLYDGLAAAPDAADLVARIVELRRLAGLPERLRDRSIPRARLRELADAASEQWTAGFNPVPVSPEDLRGVYEAAY